MSWELYLFQMKLKAQRVSKKRELLQSLRTPSLEEYNANLPLSIDAVCL